MSFLSHETLKSRIVSDNIIINGFEEDNIKSAAYELSMGHEAFVTTEQIKEVYEKGNQIVIEPGQFAILLTKEKLSVPFDLIAFISVKFSIKKEGLVNVSGFHVDPGFNGRLKFAVYNAGSRNVVITCGEPAFQIWFATLDKEDKSSEYDGDHNGQNNITANDVMQTQGDIISPTKMKERIDKLERVYETIKTLAFGVIISLSGWFIVELVRYLQQQ
ncbi:dCTP deaminase [Fodinibius salsisoli]|uniref:Deoxycytidine triphosphate deaminase n=1 Tax=Fodinibius salsisoli TaxID=2820877 RepID=A0ABT3PSL7_9BACT|nr:2'-deoxycytidine 5'-triphosphate deaminase [Fodinibius salsisoli]MCW9708846.1 hypothetical protein [Fodinibius salsisoli]